jgi:hypothetical protein
VLGRPLSEVAGHIWSNEVPITLQAGEVYQQGIPRSIVGAGSDGQEAAGRNEERHPAYTLVPRHAADGTISGVIIYTIYEVQVEQRTAEPGQLDTLP